MLVSNIYSNNLFKRFLDINPLRFLSTTIILYILRMVGPHVNIVFIPFLFFYFLFTFYHFINQRKTINLNEMIRFNFYLILMSSLLLWGFIISSAFIFPIFKELLNIVIFLFLNCSLFIFIKDKESFNKFTEIFSKQIIFFSSLVSICGLLKFYFQLKGITFSFLNLPGLVEGTSLTTDNNFYILFSFVGIISIIFGLRYFKWRTSFLGNGIFSILLLILSLNVLFSYSRRGFIILLILMLCSILLIIIGYKKKDNLFFIISTYFLSFSLLVIFIIRFIFITPTHIKRNTLDILGITVNDYKYYSFLLVGKYSNIYSSRDRSYFRDIVWIDNPDPRNPDTGWGESISKRDFPLSGEKVEIVPENSIGYVMDSTCDASTWNNNAYSYTNISSLFKGDSITDKNGTYNASVYCFVSNDFDGIWARISAEGKVSGNTYQEYDLNKKGTWQKIQINFTSSSGIQPVYLFWSKNGVTDFKSLKGYIIYAYPEYYKNPGMGEIK